MSVLELNAQEPGMWHITDRDGLPSMTVYHMAQDSMGYIWMGTEKGICRFDGKDFKTYSSPNLYDNEILKVEIDLLGRVWFRNLSGQLFYIENETIYDAADHFGGNEQGVFDFAIQGKTVWILFKEQIGQNYVNTIAYLTFDRWGNFSSLNSYKEKLWYSSALLAVDQSVFILGNLKEDGAKRLIQLDITSDSFKNKITLNVAEVGRLKSLNDYNGERYGLFYKDGETIISKIENGNLDPVLILKGKDVVNNVTVVEDNFWMLTKQGVLVKSIGGGTVKKNSEFLKGVACNRLLLDHEGNKWIATSGKGIYVVTALQTEVFQMDNFNMPNDEVYSLAQDSLRERLLVGYNNGVASVMNKEYENQVFSFFPTGRMNDILVDKTNSYWYVNDLGIAVQDANLQVVNTLANQAKVIIESEQGQFWIGNHAIVFKSTRDDIIFHNAEKSIRENGNEIISERTYALLEDASANIWMGSVKGVYIYKDEKVLPFLEDGKHLPYSVSSMTESQDSIIWVGTKGDGVFAIKNDKVIFRYKKENGLASNTVKKIYASKKHLWVLTDNGINKLDLDTKNWEWINTSDGLPSNDVNDIEVFNENVWIATAKGLTKFSEDANHTNNTAPPIYISRIQLEDRDTVVQDSFDLSYDKNSVQIDFVGIGFRGKGEISYQYKLVGVDKEWINTKSRVVRYPNLNPGNYHFEVFALNEDQTKSTQPASVHFFISPPWWKTWWFAALSILTIGGVISYFVNAKIQKRNREQAFLEQVNELKTMALRSQMNPHFIFNALNAIQKFLTTNNREQAMIYLSRFGKLIRNIFEQSQKEKISLEEELEFLNLYLDLEKLRFMDRVNIQMEVSPEVMSISDEIYVPPLLIQPIIENSFKHGFLYENKLGVLKVHFSKQKTYLFCTIEDNGIGRKKAAELGQKTLKDRPSSGLQTAKERVDIYNEKNDINYLSEQSNLKIIDLLDDDKKVKGTLVELRIYCKGFEFIEEL